MPNRNRKNRAGTVRRTGALTLVEVIVALSLVAIGLVGLIKLQLISMKTGNQAEFIMNATMLADSKLAETLAQGYPSIGTRQGSEPFGQARIQWQVEVRNEKFPGWERQDMGPLRQVRVTTHWTQGSREGQVHLTTLVAERSLP